MSDLPEWARRLDLAPHPEGGWYRETWRSDLMIPQSSLPPDYSGPRHAGTAILFLLLPGQQSAWHTVRSAELWLYHRCSPLTLEIGSHQHSATAHLLGSDEPPGELAPHLRTPMPWPDGTAAQLARAVTGREITCGWKWYRSSCSSGRSSC